MEGEGVLRVGGGGGVAGRSMSHSGEEARL